MPVALYALAIGVNAFLLFLVQPLIGKALLPRLGGGAAVWTVCLLFFQAMLLLGYLAAHLVATRLRPRLQGGAFLAAVAASLVALPIHPDPARVPAPGAEPAPFLLIALATGVGLPYLVLAATGPLAQRWFTADHPGRAPWPLFALSNAGALGALLAYPLLLEPATRLAWQLDSWSVAYAIGCGATALLALARWRGGELPPALAPAAVRRGDVALWLGLSATGTALLTTLTARITQNVAPVPLLWIAPLALYLLSFVLAFAGLYPRFVALLALPTALAALAALPSLELAEWSLPTLLALWLAAGFVAFLAAHGELARRRPDSGDLTRYYLAIAAGGALGGLIPALVTPLILDTDPDLALATFALALAVVAALAPSWRTAPRSLRIAFRLGALVALALLAAGLLRGYARETGPAQESRRNFYGVLRVAERADPLPVRRLFHGRILHGEQFLDDDKRRWATTYYGPVGGGALAIFATRRDPAPQRVGIVGLGIGTLAAWGRAGDVYRFYEIDPLVVRLATTRFSFLADSPAAIEIELSDARLALEREAAQGFDVLIVDAFSGDAVPVHLLTREAFATYFRHVAPGGIVAVHVSNRFLDLAPVVAAAAGTAGRVARLVESGADEALGTTGATWVVIAAAEDEIAFGFFEGRTRGIALPPDFRAWTDDFSSLLAVLRRVRRAE